jgi:hypothetical protein
LLKKLGGDLEDETRLRYSLRQATHAHKVCQGAEFTLTIQTHCPLTAPKPALIRIQEPAVSNTPDARYVTRKLLKTLSKLHKIGVVVAVNLAPQLQRKHTLLHYNNGLDDL